MTLDPVSRRMRVELINGGSTVPVETYGTDTFGSSLFGRETGEPTVDATEYLIVPAIGWSPADPGWVFRKGDALQPFSAYIVSRNNPRKRIDTTEIVDSRLMLRQIDLSQRSIVYYYPLTITVDVFSNSWINTDELEPGLYELGIYLTFGNQRSITLPFTDSSTLQIVDSP